MGLKWRAVAKRECTVQKTRSIHRNVATKFEPLVCPSVGVCVRLGAESAMCDTKVRRVCHTVRVMRWGMRNEKVQCIHLHTHTHTQFIFVGRSVFIISITFSMFKNRTRSEGEDAQRVNKKISEKCSWIEQQGKNIAIWNEKDNTHTTAKRKKRIR